MGGQPKTSTSGVEPTRCLPLPLLKEGDPRRLRCFFPHLTQDGLLSRAGTSVYIALSSFLQQRFAAWPRSERAWPLLCKMENHTYVALRKQ